MPSRRTSVRGDFLAPVSAPSAAGNGGFGRSPFSGSLVSSTDPWFCSCPAASWLPVSLPGGSAQAPSASLAVSSSGPPNPSPWSSGRSCSVLSVRRSSFKAPLSSKVWSELGTFYVSELPAARPLLGWFRLLVLGSSNPSSLGGASTPCVSCVAGCAVGGSSAPSVSAVVQGAAAAVGVPAAATRCRPSAPAAGSAVAVGAVGTTGSTAAVGCSAAGAAGVVALVTREAAVVGVPAAATCALKSARAGGLAGVADAADVLGVAVAGVCCGAVGRAVVAALHGFAGSELTAVSFAGAGAAVCAGVAGNAGWLCCGCCGPGGMLCFGRFIRL